MNNIRNISHYYRIYANICYIKNLFKMFYDFNQTYKNYFEVIIKYLKNSYPIEIILKNGERFVLTNSHPVLVITLLKDHHNLEYDISNDIVTISSIPWLIDDKIKVKFYGGITNGDINTVFLKNEYRILPVKEKTVVDIGSNIGDSPIYFALRGANKIIALEPFPKNYELAEQNIKLNNFSDKIIMLLAGCSSISDHIIIDPNLVSNVDSRIDRSKTGTNIPLMTLNDIINNYDVPEGSILKMDCEGCEYETILSSSSEILKKFSDILIEYHHGYQNLKEKLEKCGFRVSITKPVSAGFIGAYMHKFKQSFGNTKQKDLVDTDKQENYSKSNKGSLSKYIGTIHATQISNF